MSIFTFAYDVSLGDTTVDITIPQDVPTKSTSISMQVIGAGITTGSVTTKLQESNVFAVGRTDITGATVTSAIGASDAFVVSKEISGGFLAYDIAVGAATAGTITLIIYTR